MEVAQVTVHLYSVLYNKCNRVKSRPALVYAVFLTIGLLYYLPSSDLSLIILSQVLAPSQATPLDFCLASRLQRKSF